MRMDIDKIRNEFFKKSFSVGYHNVAYTWEQLMLVVLGCIRCLKTYNSDFNSNINFKENFVALQCLAAIGCGPKQWAIRDDRAPSMCR